MVMFFFDEDRLATLTSWTPNKRVLYTLYHSPSFISDQAHCQLECLEMDTSAVRMMKEFGDVKFSKSQTKGDVKSYLVEADIKTKPVQMTFEVRDSSNTLMEVRLLEGQPNCDCP